MASNRSNTVWTQNTGSGSQKCQSKNPSIFGITFCRPIWHFSGWIAVFTTPEKLECVKSRQMYQVLPKPDWPRLSLFENSKLFRSEFESFGHPIDPDHKTLISDKRLGIGNHQNFGISKIGLLRFSKQLQQIVNTRMTVFVFFPGIPRSEICWIWWCATAYPTAVNFLDALVKSAGARF